MLVTILDGALIPCLPDVFLVSFFFIRSFYPHVVFERSSEWGWHSLSGTSSNGRGGKLEQVAWVLATQRQEKLS